MEVKKIYRAIEEGRLFRLIGKQTKNDKTYLRFKRHDSEFTFIFTPENTDGETHFPEKYALLKDKEKARLGTVRAMWQDFSELPAE